VQHSNLVHMTDVESALEIESSNKINGRYGIFAVPDYYRNHTVFLRVIGTGLSPEKTARFIAIPDKAVTYFRKPLPIGVYTLWKWLGDVFVTDAGSIALHTGEVIFVGGYRHAMIRFVLYGPDVLLYTGIMVWLALAYAARP
jgi:hypothetical protein